MLTKMLRALFATLFLTAGFVPPQSLHYCEMLGRTTKSDCGVCHGPTTASVSNGCCSIARPVNARSAGDCVVSDDGEQRCCSIQIADPFPAGASGTMHQPGAPAGDFEICVLALAPATGLRDLNRLIQTEIIRDIVSPLIAPIPACITGSGFLC